MKHAKIGRLLAGGLLVGAVALGGGASADPGTPATSSGGNFIATGHDMDLHCAFGATDECSYFKIVVDKVRNGSTLPILALSPPSYYSYYFGSPSELTSALDKSGYGGQYVSVDPSTPAFANTPFVDSAGKPLYSAILTASDSTCGGCDNTVAGETATNARSADFTAFFNAGGGIGALSGADNFGTYYDFVPLKVAGTAVSGPFTVTPDGAALGITDSMANCCPTHNSFAPPPAAFQTLEVDGAGNAETIGAFGAKISDGGFTGGGAPAPDQTITASGTAVSSAEGRPLTGAQTASFTDPDAAATAGEYTATINWGDGTAATSGVVAGPTGGPFTVSGDHTYAEEGTYTVTTSITDTTDATNGATATSTAVVADAPLTAGTLTATDGTEGTKATVASLPFTDANPGATPADFTATATWGDGSSSPATVTGSSSGYTASASHTYAEEGKFAVAITVTDAGGSTTNGKGTATVTDAPLTSTGTNTTSTQTFSGTVASFSDADPQGTASDYTATINWGDGTASTPGTIGGHFNVSGTHTYAQTGPYTITVHIADAGGATTDATSHVLVYAFASSNGGSFAIGDVNSAPGSSVEFWGAKWAKDNTLSSGSAPSSFKGYAGNPSSNLPACGGTYTTSTGNSSTPPSTVPAYLAVFVSSKVTQAGSTVTGNIQHLEIVKTDPGYAADPGHAGTGKVIATIC